MKSGNKPDPTKAKIQKVATICLGLLFVVLLIKTLAGKDDVSGPVTRAAAKSGATRTAQASPPVDEENREPVIRLARHSGHSPDSAECAPPPNPFQMSTRLKEDITGVRRTTGKASSSAPKQWTIRFKLRGIVADLTNGEHVALIDDELLQIGDEHRAYTVLDITRTEVVLDNGRDRQVLRLEER